jgi:SNF2 family DNA or RNA helicase
MIRRLKSDVLSELPSKRRQRIEVACDSKLIKKIDKIMADLKEIREEADIFSGK